MEKLAGISGITTDIETNIATFRLANKDLDLKSKLDEFAKSNEHMKDWSFLEH